AQHQQLGLRSICRKWRHHQCGGHAYRHRSHRIRTATEHMHRHERASYHRRTHRPRESVETFMLMNRKQLSSTLSERTSRGMTLVEILVTVVLISVGLLGIAALQLTTLRSNQEALIRSQASELANNILDRMRANQAGFLADQYNVDFDGTGPAGTAAGNDLARSEERTSEVQSRAK